MIIIATTDLLRKILVNNNELTGNASYKLASYFYFPKNQKCRTPKYMSTAASGRKEDSAEFF